MLERIAQLVPADVEAFDKFSVQPEPFGGGCRGRTALAFSGGMNWDGVNLVPQCGQQYAAVVFVATTGRLQWRQ